MQWIQNYAARVILRLPMSSSITIHLKSLHWLPVKVRSTYKIYCLCYHCHSSTAPSYVTDMLHRKPLHTRNTRSSSYTMPLLNRPAHSKATLGNHSFSFASSSVWNSIPNDVRCAPSLSSSKSRLKIYLFCSVYNNTLLPVCSYTRTELLSLRTKTSLLSLSTVDRLKDLNIGYHLPRRHRSSRGVKRKKHNLHSFIVASFNAQSVKGNDMACKRCETSTFIKDNGVDLFFVTETWLSAHGDEAKTAELAPSGFDVKSFPRQSRSRGGGIATVYKSTLGSSITFKTCFDFTHTSFEVVQASITLQHNTLHFFCLYRPPPNRRNNLTDSMFTEQLPNLLNYVNSLPGHVCLVGDMNIHFDNPLQSLTKQTLSTLSLYGLVQVINKPTHRCGHIIDWVIVRPDDDIHRKSTVTDSLESDHYCTKSYFNISVSKPSTLYRTVRNIANIDRPSFIAELSSVSEFSSVENANQFCDFLRTVLDKHAPPSMRKVVTHSSSPWFESIRDELFIAKRERRQAERKWRNTKLAIFKDLYGQAKHKVSILVHTAKCKFYTERIALASSSKELHQIVNTLSNRHPPKILPTI